VNLLVLVRARNGELSFLCALDGLIYKPSNGLEPAFYKSLATCAPEGFVEFVPKYFGRSSSSLFACSCTLCCQFFGHAEMDVMLR
jgi:hypothetical protein